MKLKRNLTILYLYELKKLELNCNSDLKVRWNSISSGLSCLKLSSFFSFLLAPQICCRTVNMLLSRFSKRCFCTATAFPNPRPWLFVGLGNPGDKFMGTRHNVGFEFIDAFAKSQGISMDSVHCKAIFGKGLVDGVPVFLAKPQTYMNLSGESSGPLAAYYKLPLNRVLVLHDDMNLPCGVLRLNPLGNHGSHNGLKSVIYHFRGNREFPRLRIGIGRPPGQMDPKAFLLQKFNARARERIDTALQEGIDALKQVVAKGLTESARCFNRDQKYKHIRLQTMPV